MAVNRSSRAMIGEELGARIEAKRRARDVGCDYRTGGCRDEGSYIVGADCSFGITR